MTMPIRIEQIGPATIDEAFHLLQRFFREEGFPTPADEMHASLQEMIDAATSAVFLARSGPIGVGVATVTTSVGVEYGLCAELEDLYVLPEQRHQGVATALIEAVCAWCFDRGVTTVEVIVTPEGDRDHHLLDYYQRRGFTHTHRVVLARRLGDRPGARA